MNREEFRKLELLLYKKINKKDRDLIIDFVLRNLAEF